MEQAHRIKQQMGAAEWATLVGLSVLWGGSFFFIDVAVRTIQPFTLVLLRVTLAAAVLILLLRLRGEPLRPSRGMIGGFLFMGLINNVVPFSLLAWGQTQIGAGLASILNATTPIWGALLAHLFTTDEKLTPARAAGVLIGFGGVVVMIGPGLLDELGAAVLAQLACIGAAFAYGVAGVYGRRFRRLGISPMTVSAGQLAASALLLLPVAFLAESPWRAAAPAPEAWASVIALALFSTTFAYVLYFRLIATAGATNALLVTLLVPVTAILLGVTLLGERLDPRALAGMGLIAIGLAAIDGRLLRLLRRRPL